MDMKSENGANEISASYLHPVYTLQITLWQTCWV